jgi:hypothetical protein
MPRSRLFTLSIRPSRFNLQPNESRTPTRPAFDSTVNLRIPTHDSFGSLPLPVRSFSSASFTNSLNPTCSVKIMNHFLINQTNFALVFRAELSPRQPLQELQVKPIPGLRHVLENGSLWLLPFAAHYFRASVHSSTYKCVAHNEFGAVVSQSTHLHAGKNSLSLSLFMSSCNGSRYIFDSNQARP